MYHDYNNFPSYSPPAYEAHFFPSEESKGQKLNKDNLQPLENSQQTPNYPLYGCCQNKQVESNLYDVANARWEKKSKLYILDQVIKGVAVAALITLAAAICIGSTLGVALIPGGLGLAVFFPGLILAVGTALAGMLTGSYWHDNPGPNYHNRDDANKISLQLKSDKLENLKNFDINELKRYGFVDNTVAGQLHQFQKQSRKDNQLIQKVENSQVYAKVLRENKDDPILNNYWIAKQRQDAKNAEWETFQRDVLANHLPSLPVRA